MIFFGGVFTSFTFFGAGGMVNGPRDDTGVVGSPLLTIASIIADSFGFDADLLIFGNDEQVCIEVSSY